MAPPPPVRLTATTGLPSFFDIRSARTCAVVCAEPPNRTVISTGFSGNSARAAAGTATNAAAAKAEMTNFEGWKAWSRMSILPVLHHWPSCNSICRFHIVFFAALELRDCVCLLTSREILLLAKCRPDPLRRRRERGDAHANGVVDRVHDRRNGRHHRGLADAFDAQRTNGIRILDDDRIDARHVQ